jgi:prevent-host-death family protein
MVYMTTMTVSEARAGLPEVLDRVGKGEEVTITRHGRPVAVVVRPDALRSRRADKALRTAEQTREAISTGRRSALRRAGGITPERADELVAGIRTDRDTRP